MLERYFYDVPVYRLSREKYYKEMNECIKKQMDSGSPRHIEMMKEFHRNEPTLRRSAEDSLRQSYGGSWEYNEIIGYIRLYFFGTQVRGEYWGINSKRIVRTRKKIFEHKTWKLAPEIDLHQAPDSSSIFLKIQEYLMSCQKELKGRYIDITHLMTIGPYVNWKILYEESKYV